MLLSREPVALSALIAAVAVILSRVGLNLDGEVQAAIEVIILAVAVVFARSRVSPVE